MLDRLSIALAVGSAVVGLTAGFLSPSPTDLTFLSVGQGDCTVFRHQGAVVLIDAGPKTANFDAGESIIWPELRQMGISSIDLILLSHPDADHIGGLSALHKHFHIGAIGFPSSFRQDTELLNNLKEAGFSSDEVVWLGASNVEVADARLEIDAEPWFEGMPDNDGSMFVRLEVGSGSAMFTGDASEVSEYEILSERRIAQVQIYHVGHHGSKSSTSRAWLSALRPTYGVISCGLNNSYGHPHPEVLDRLRAAGTQVFRTDLLGSLRFRLDSSGFSRQ